MESNETPRIIAVIPVKRVSERVPNKNFRPFSKDGKSLIDLLLEKLAKVNRIDHIYISTNKDDIEINLTSNVSIIDRNEEYCNNITPWSDVIYNVVNSLPEKDNTIIMWCHTTTPLFNEYDNALEMFIGLEKSKFNSLVVVAVDRYDYFRTVVL